MKSKTYAKEKRKGEDTGATEETIESEEKERKKFFLRLAEPFLPHFYRSKPRNFQNSQKTCPALLLLSSSSPRPSSWRCCSRFLPWEPRQLTAKASLERNRRKKGGGEEREEKERERGRKNAAARGATTLRLSLLISLISLSLSLSLSLSKKTQKAAPPSA